MLIELIFGGLAVLVMLAGAIGLIQRQERRVARFMADERRRNNEEHRRIQEEREQLDELLAALDHCRRCPDRQRADRLTRP